MAEQSSRIVQQREDHYSRTEYIFVAAIGQEKVHNDHIRRSHVMRNTFKQRRMISTSSSGTTTRAIGPLAAGKRSFRTNANSLEERHTPAKPTEAVSYQSDTSNDLPDTQDQSSSRVQLRHSTMSTDDLSPQEIQSLLSRSTSPLILFGKRRIDPFGVLPFNLTPWDEVLLDRFCHYKKWPWCPINGQNLWPEFALSDELVFSATLFSWGTSFHHRLTGQQASSFIENNPGIIRHKLSTISMVNRRVSEPALAVKDETIAAVVALTNLELLFGDRSVAAHHMKGLKTLVTMRGGYPTFVTDSQLLVRRLISSTDLMYSELFRVPLFFAPIEIWDLPWRKSDQMFLPGSPIGLSSKDLEASGVEHHEMIDILGGVNSLSRAEEIRPLITLNEHEKTQRADSYLKVERRLMLIVHATDSVAMGGWNASVWKITALTTLIFVHHFLRHNPFKLRYFALLVEQLYHVMSRLGENFPELTFSRSLLLWILTIGAVASSHTERHGWFVQKLSNACALYSMGWHELRAQLVGFMWTGPADEGEYVEMWQRVEEVRASGTIAA